MNLVTGLITTTAAFFILDIHLIILTDAIIFVIVGIWLTTLVSRNLSRPFTQIGHD